MSKVDARKKTHKDDGGDQQTKTTMLLTSQLRIINDKLQGELDKSQRECVRAKADHERIQKTCAELKARRDALERDLEHLKSGHETLLSDYDALHSEYRALFELFKNSKSRVLSLETLNKQLGFKLLAYEESMLEYNYQKQEAGWMQELQ